MFFHIHSTVKKCEPFFFFLKKRFTFLVSQNIKNKYMLRVPRLRWPKWNELSVIINCISIVFLVFGFEGRLSCFTKNGGAIEQRNG